LINEEKSAIVLLSGGMDSTTCLALAEHQGFRCYGLSFRYGQRHDVELRAAKRVAAAYTLIDHLVIDFDLRQIGGSALTLDADEADLTVPKDRDEDYIGQTVPPTYVPARNTIFLSFALAWCEVLGVRDIFIGVNAMDYSGYPDCRPEFIAAFEQLALTATKAGAEESVRTRIHAPLMAMTKAQIVRAGLEHGVDFSLTHTCYDPDADDRSCGRCDACRLRLKGFSEAGVDDPIAYVVKAGVDG